MNIGFFPLSGIRVCNAELLRLGLTLPGFVERSTVIASLPSLGLLTLAGLTPSGHRLHYVEVPDGRLPGPLPDGLDLAVLSTYSAQAAEAYDLADRFRAAGVPTVIGGPHVTAVPDEAAERCDAVVAGEGEPVWRQLLGDAAAGRLRARYRADGDFDLAQAPMPAYELLDISRYNRLTVQTSRGCPHRCEFCAGSVVLTGGYAQKPVARVLEEIDRICSIWPRPFIEFADDNSFVDRAYWRDLLPELARRNVRWFAETDVSVADDGRLLDLMRRSGCAEVLIGLESPVETGLKGLELRGDWKLARCSGYRDAVRAIQARGIRVNGCFILGLDGQTAEIFDRIPPFVRETALYDVQITLMTPFPGTPLYARLEREGRLLEPRNWSACTLFDVNYRPTHMTPEELRDGFRKLAVELYGEEFTAWRRGRFRESLRGRRATGGTS